MREERSFYNGLTSRKEVWLERFTQSPGKPAWCVSEYGHRVPNAMFADTDEGYAAARADYEMRVGRMMSGGERNDT
jgi:hypothetical protein